MRRPRASRQRRGRQTGWLDGRRASVSLVFGIGQAAGVPRTRDATRRMGYLASLVFFAGVFAVGFFLAGVFFAAMGVTAIVRVIAVPIAVPFTAVGVSVSTFEAAAERLSPASVPLGTVKRTSLFPARRLTVPSAREPKAALARPWPLALTINLICVVVAESLSNWGPKTSIVGAMSADETGITGEVTVAGGGGLTGRMDVTWVVESTSILAVTSKSAASTLCEAFGSARNPSPLAHVQVSHGIDAVALLPLTGRGTVTCPDPAQ